jgi:hypothetical protein
VSYISSTTNTHLFVDFGGGVVAKPLPHSVGTTDARRPAFVFKGPALVTLDASATGAQDIEFVTFKITSDKDNLAPSNAVVIPAAANGPSFNVILEQSADLLTWTAASPGTYTPSTEKRFFRCRSGRSSPAQLKRAGGQRRALAPFLRDSSCCCSALS